MPGKYLCTVLVAVPVSNFKNQPVPVSLIEPSTSTLSSGLAIPIPTFCAYKKVQLVIANKMNKLFFILLFCKNEIFK